MADEVRHVEDIDADLAARSARRLELREERTRLKNRRFISEEEMERDLKVNTQRIDAQTEFIEGLMEERAVATAYVPDTLDEWLDQEGNPTR